jgi:hypothetical protein
VTEFENIKPNNTVHNIPHITKDCDIFTDTTSHPIYMTPSKIHVILSDNDDISIIGSDDGSEDGSDDGSDDDESIDNTDDHGDDNLKIIHINQDIHTDEHIIVQQIEMDVNTSNIPDNELNLEPSINETSNDIYKKMNLTQLKQHIIEKGLISDPSKYKKAELIKILTDNNSNID